MLEIQSTWIKVVARLVEWSLLTIEARGSNADIRKLYIYCIEKFNMKK